MTTGHLWKWVEEPCARCRERSLKTGTGPILDVPVFFPPGPEECWAEMHRPLCTRCFQAERAAIGHSEPCAACPERLTCAGGAPSFKGICAALATAV
jgi:hypothetical protein